MPVPQLTNGTLVNADHWKAHVDLINATETKANTLETNQGTRGTNGTVYAEIGNLKSADEKWPSVLEEYGN